MDWYIDNYWYLLLLLLLPLLAILIFNFVKWKRKRRGVFADERFHSNLFEKNTKFSKFLPVLYLLATLFLIFSIIDLLNGSEEVKSKQKMNNVIFLMDVSNSMNAEDLQPNRLTEAKNIILQTIDKMQNDRVGIVVFAGEANSVMPLTTDFTAAQNYINAIETNVVQIQGTDFLKGIQVSADKFKNIPKGSRKIVLISDGEDNEGNEDAAIKEAKKQGITVITVGVGTDEGAPVPEYVFGQLMGYKNDANGATVVSKRQTNALKNIGESTGGDYIDGNNLKDAATQITESLAKKSSTSEIFVKSQNATHYYQYFLIVSIFFFFIIFLFNPKRDFNI